MIDLTNIKSVYLFIGDTDFRNGLAGLTRKVLTSFDNKKTINCLYVFCNKTRKQLKILQFDNTGIWLYQKKMESGKFIYPSNGTVENIETKDLRTLLEGLDFIHKINNTYAKEYDYF